MIIPNHLQNVHINYKVNGFTACNEKYNIKHFVCLYSFFQIIIDLKESK